MGKSIFEFADKFGYNSPWEEPQSIQQTTPPKIIMKCSTGTVRIKINTIASINLKVEGSSGWGLGYDYKIILTSDDRFLRIYDDSFSVDKGWSFIAQISNEKQGISALKLSASNKLAATFNFEFVNEKSAFTTADKDTIVNENSDLVGDDKICFRVADKELSKLLADPSLILKDYSSLSGFSRIEDYDKKGYVYENKLFNQSNIWKRNTDGDYKLKPYEFASGQERCFSGFVKKTMNCIGIHVYHFILLKGYHVLVLLVDNTNDCKHRFKIIDQLKIREWDELDNLDEELLAMTIRNYEGACDHAKRKDIDSSINLCKIKTR